MLTEEIARSIIGYGDHARRVGGIEDRVAYAAHGGALGEVRDMCVFDSSPMSTYRVLREKVDARHQGSWWLGYHNGEAEALIEEAARTPDDAARHALFRRIHGILVADPPWLFCYCETHRTGIAGDHPGWTMRHDGVLDVRTLPASPERA